MSRRIPIALAILFSLPLSADGVQLTTAELENASTAALAHKTLPGDVLPRIAFHRLEDRHPIVANDRPAYGAIRFFLQPTGAAADICRRDTWYVPLQSASQLTASSYKAAAAVGPIVQLAIASNCTVVPEAAFGWFQSHRPVEDAIAVLSELMAIQRQMRNNVALPLDVECRSTLPDADPCRVGAMQVFRMLPLDRTLMIAFQRGTTTGAPGWLLGIMPDGPGRPFFRVWLPDIGPAHRRIQLTWMAPLPS